MISRLHVLRMAGIGVFLAPVSAFAQRQLVVGTGTNVSFWGIVSRIITYLTATIGVVALTMFIVGAFMITISGIKEEYRQSGKDLMIGGILSMAVVGGAYAILRTVDFFLS